MGRHTPETKLQWSRQKLKFRQTKKAEFQAINAIKYLQEIVQLEFGAF